MLMIRFPRLVVFAALIVCGSAGAQRDFSEVRIKPIQVADGIYMLQGSGGNIGLSVGEDGALIIDDQFAPLAPKIQAVIQELGGAQPSFILNTHHHGDHTGGNAIFGAWGVIVAHENVRLRLLSRRVNDQPLPRSAFPEITYRHGLSIHFNGDELRVAHFPAAHTDGDGVVFFTRSNVVHMGDLLFNGRFPYIDLGSGGTVAGYTDAVRALEQQIPSDAKIIPGHGDLATHGDLVKFLRMLEESAALVRAGIEAGSSLEQLQAGGMPEEWSSWGQGWIDNDRWLSIVYESLR
jgi:cyclase